MNECRECRSTRIMKDVRAGARNYESSYGIEVIIHERPNWMIFKGAKFSTTKADVCADCGYVSIYATELKTLWDAYQKREQNRS